MGNLFSNNKSQQKQEQDQQKHEIYVLEQRLKDLEKIDKNGDGAITRDELDDWKERQQEDLNSFRENIIKMKDQEYEEKLIDLNKQVEALKAINNGLEKQMIEITQDISLNRLINPNAQTKIFSQLSKQKIQELVDRMISNEAINIAYLPDFAEKQLYKNMFNILLGLLNELIEGSSIDILGHEITMRMNAKVENTNNEENNQENNEENLDN